MNEISEGVSDLPEVVIEEIDRSAADLIPDCARALNACARSAATVGRHDTGGGPIQSR